MITVKAKTDRAFGKRLEDRMRKWAGAGKFAARIRTSAEIDWWYWQEFGTAPYKLKPDPTGQYHDVWAAIWRRDQGALSFEVNGQHFLTLKIDHHPGIPARNMVGSVLPAIREQAAALIHQLASQIPDNPEALRVFVLRTAENAKAEIRDSFAEKLSPTPREGGRLKTSAAQAYDDNATIVSNK